MYIEKCTLLPAMPVNQSKKHILAATLIPYLLNITPSLPTITQKETRSSMSQLAAQAILMQRVTPQPSIMGGAGMQISMASRTR